jgi:hypothetical protein
MTDTQCKECGDNLRKGYSPTDVLTRYFKIPFTDWYIGLVKDEPEMYCYECLEASV